MSLNEQINNIINNLVFAYTVKVTFKSYANFKALKLMLTRASKELIAVHDRTSSFFSGRVSKLSSVWRPSGKKKLKDRSCIALKSEKSDKLEQNHPELKPRIFNIVNPQESLLSGPSRGSQNKGDTITRAPPCFTPTSTITFFLN